MKKPFEEGYDIICAGNKRESEELIKQIYYFGVPNGVNEKYTTLNDFKKFIFESSADDGESAEQIIEDIKNMFAQIL